MVCINNLAEATSKCPRQKSWSLKPNQRVKLLVLLWIQLAMFWMHCEWNCVTVRVTSRALTCFASMAFMNLPVMNIGKPEFKSDCKKFWSTFLPPAKFKPGQFLTQLHDYLSYFLLLLGPKLKNFAGHCLGENL